MKVTIRLTYRLSQPHAGLVIRKWNEGPGGTRAHKRQEPVGVSHEWRKLASKKQKDGRKG